MEWLDVYDTNRAATGRTMKRGDKHAPGDYHQVIHVCIFNAAGEMLIQQRQPFKKGWSNLWDVTVGGAVSAGETSAFAAGRELEEELGYQADLSRLRPHLTVNFTNGFDDYYLLEAEVELDALRLQYEEVQRVKWAPKDEIIAMIREGVFIPYYEEFISLLFTIRGGRGVFSR